MNSSRRAFFSMREGTGMRAKQLICIGIHLVPLAVSLIFVFIYATYMLTTKYDYNDYKQPAAAGLCGSG